MHDARPKGNFLHSRELKSILELLEKINEMDWHC